MSAIQNLLQTVLTLANEQFFTNDKRAPGKNEYYIAVPATLYSRTTGPSSAQMGVALPAPHVFLLGSPDTAYQATRASPSISLLVGQYGTGKTELISQLRFVHESVHVLAISLGIQRTRWADFARTQDNRPAAFAELVLGRLMAAIGDADAVALQRAIQLGDVILALDGLDELVTTREEYEAFFRGLLAYLGDQATCVVVPRFNVIISAREEFMRSINLADFEELEPYLHDMSEAAVAPCASVYLVSMGKMSLRLVKEYLRKRGAKYKDLLEYVNRHPSEPLATMLQRPLLLWLVCKTVKEHGFLLATEQLDQPMKLLRTFIQDHRQGELTVGAFQHVSYAWDLDKTAEKMLRQHLREAGLHYEFPDTFVSDCVRSVDGEEIGQATRDLIVHKCPFIIRVEGEQCAFSHRIFYEFFLARGVFLEDQRSRTDDFDSFDELVLNPDTRWFLHDMIEEAKPGNWRVRTLRSYSLSGRHFAEWDQIGRHLSDGEIEQLEELRWRLLEVMTNPCERRADDLATIEEFLKCCADRLHPRFLMYNFEAVAVYWSLIYRDGSEGAKALRARFERVLREHLHKSEQNLQEATPPLRRAWSLLFLKCIDIAIRLSFPWVREYAAQKRIEHLQSVFPTDWAPAEKALKKADNPLFV